MTREQNDPALIGTGVRTLCDFAARTGDLDLRYTPSPTSEEGREGHRRVAASRGPEYQTEHHIEGECQGLLLRGRADGYDPGKGELEEVKTHRGDLSRVNPGQQALHWAQLRTYGALLCRRDGLPGLTLRLVYYDLQQNSESVLTLECDAATLWAELEALCHRYRQWAEQEVAHRKARDQALGRLRFPFADFRAGQRSLAEAVYKTLALKRAALLQAPTGSGKTVGTLYPALISMAYQDLDRLFFLTVRNTGRQLAVEGLQRVQGAQEARIPLRTLTLTARDQACEYPDRACHGESCPLAKGFYDRLPGARQAAVNQDGILDREAVRVIALAHGICPYYLGQELARWCDLVVADVNYLFDQQALLYALTRQNEWRVGVLVDEAHNLLSRGRSMYSTSLSRAQLRNLKRQAPAALKKPLDALTRSWRNLLKTHQSAVSEAQKEGSALLLASVPLALHGALQKVVVAITDYLSEHPAQVQLQDLLFEALGFLQLADSFGEHSLCELSLDDAGEPSLAIENLVPADFLAPRFAACRGVALFSATLNPYHYHRDLLGLPESTLSHTVESPFVADQLEVRVVRGISTRLRDRVNSAAQVANRISARFQGCPANYLVYLSSFAYLELLQSAFTAAAPDIPTRWQRRGMSASERQEFIDSFQEGGQQVGFAVLGGAFSEGIDLPGSRLTGVFILTLGLPPHDSRHAELCKRLQRRFGQGGYAYTYLYPGLQKVVQAAGRVIRTPEDQGIIELIDDRFSSPEVRQLLPAWWPEPQMVDLATSRE